MEPRLKLGSNSDSIVYTTPVHCTHFMQLGEQVLHLTVSVLFSHFSYLPISPPLFWLNIVLELVENRVPDSGDRTLEINQSEEQRA